MNKTNRYPIAFCFTLALAVLLLLLSTFLPQGPIDRNVRDSAYALKEDAYYPRILDKAYSSQLDHFTDSIMLMESKAMSAEQIDTIFTNPMFNDGGKYPQDNLLKYVEEENPTPGSYYVRYWMGFRVILRFALVFMNYYQMRRYLAFLVFALFAALISSIAKRLGQRIAMAFAISIILVRPYIICSCLQFSCCFLIAFFAMLLVPWICRNPEYEGLFFMEVGMITMYFDFYTTPIVTFGLPMAYLYLLRAAQGENTSVKRVLRSALIWFGAYILMWIAKLTLTTVFTPVNGFLNGMGAVVSWLGVSGEAILDAALNPLRALRAVAAAVIPDIPGLLVILSGLLVLAVVLFRAVRRKEVAFTACAEHRGLLLLAILPFIWFVAAAKPTIVHFWFQYRSISLTYWAIGGYLCLVLKKNGDKAARFPVSQKTV